MHLNKENILFVKNITIALISFTISILLYYWGYNNVSSIILILSSTFLVYLNKKFYGYYTNPIGIFSGIWLFTIGLATLRFHPLQVEWSYATWYCLLTAYICFVLGYFIKNKRVHVPVFSVDNKKQSFIFILLLFFCAVVSFLIECYVCKDLPFFSKSQESYKNFGISGIRYFVSSIALILPLSCIYVAKFKQHIQKKEMFWIILINVISFSIPFFIVSRGLVLTILIVTLMTLCGIYKKRELIVILLILPITMFSWKYLGEHRNQDEEYLNFSFKMNIEKYDSNTKKKTHKNSKINNAKIMRTYMYLAANYDNFDTNVKNPKKREYGLNTFFPVFALTGLKFVLHFNFSEWRFRKFVETFNTYPILATPYFDFGYIGIVFYMFIIGFLCRFIEKFYFNTILNSLCKFALCFCFFVSYFSYPAFWAYIIVVTIGWAIYSKIYEMCVKK